MALEVKNNIRVACMVAWLAAFGVGMYRARDRAVTALRLIAQTQQLADNLNRESKQIVESSVRLRESSQDSQFLQGLVNILPQSKSFMRTQRAMADELEVLRYKVGRHVKNDLHILVDTRA